jgi:hypothetical protein
VCLAAQTCLVLSCPFPEDADVAGKDVLPYDLNDPAQLDLHPAYGTPARAVGSVPFFKRLLWEGGKPFDAFLTIVSAQVCAFDGLATRLSAAPAPSSCPHSTHTCTRLHTYRAPVPHNRWAR